MAKKSDKAGDKADSPDKSDKKGKKRFETSFSVTVAVKAKSSQEAGLMATQWLVNTLVAAKKPDNITVYPPGLCENEASLEEVARYSEDGQETLRSAGKGE